MATVRAKILEDFDDDMLPCPDSPSDFSISVGSIRLSMKQEARKLAWEVIDAAAKSNPGSSHQPIVRLQAKKNATSMVGKRTVATVSEGFAQDERPLKKSRSNDAADTTSNQGNSGAAMENRVEKETNDNHIEEGITTVSTPPPPKTTPPAMETEKACDTSEASSNVYYSPVNENLAAVSTEDRIEEDAGEATNNDTEMDIIGTQRTQVDAMPAVDDPSEHNTHDATPSSLLVEAPTEDDIRSEIQVAKVHPAPKNPNAKYDEAVSNSRHLLTQLSELLQNPENASFCTEARRQEWTQEIAASLKTTAPDTIIGVLGSTGVGYVYQRGIVFVAI